MIKRDKAIAYTLVADFNEEYVSGDENSFADYLIESMDEKSHVIKNISIYNLLLEDYDYILSAMEDESFFMENNYCHLFREIVIDDYVVGFVTYNFDYKREEYLLTNIYVLKEYRGHNTLYNEILSITNQGLNISIYKPNHLIIDLLIRYGFAVKVGECLVISSIRLVLSLDQISESDESLIFNDVFASSFFYDINMSSIIILWQLLLNNVKVASYSNTYYDDFKLYSLDKKHENLNGNYFDNMLNNLIRDFDDNIQKIINMKKSLAERGIDLQALIGSNINLLTLLNVLTDSRYNEVEIPLIDNEVSLYNGEYAQMLINCYNNLSPYYVDIDDEIDYYEEDEKTYVANRYKIAEDNNLFIICPYCHDHISLSDETCQTCGYNQKDISPYGDSSFDEDINWDYDDDYEDYGEDEDYEEEND